MAFRVEEVVKNSFIRYVFGQENLVFDRKLSGKSQEILEPILRGNPEAVGYWWGQLISQILNSFMKVG